MSFDQNMIIDATKGSIARFVNHSCDPNCRMVKWIVAGKPRMALFAGDKPIMSGDELTYDYNFDPFSAKNVQECRCGSDNCRGILGPKPKDKPVKSPIKTAVLKVATGVKRKFQALVGTRDEYDFDTDDEPQPIRKKAKKEKKPLQATKKRKLNEKAKLKQAKKAKAKPIKKIKQKRVATGMSAAKGAVTAVAKSVSAGIMSARKAVMGEDSTVQTLSPKPGKKIIVKRPPIKRSRGERKIHPKKAKKLMIKKAKLAAYKPTRKYEKTGKYSKKPKIMAEAAAGIISVPKTRRGSRNAVTAEAPQPKSVKSGYTLLSPPRKSTGSKTSRKVVGNVVHDPDETEYEDIPDDEE